MLAQVFLGEKACHMPDAPVLADDDGRREVLDSVLLGNRRVHVEEDRKGQACFLDEGGDLLAPLVGRDAHDLHAAIAKLLADLLESTGLPLAASSPGGEEAQNHVLGADERRQCEAGFP